MNNSITADLITLVTELARETEATSGVTKQFQQALARLTHTPAPEAPAGDWSDSDRRELRTLIRDAWNSEREPSERAGAATRAALAFASERMAAVRGENAQLASEFNAEVDGANDLRARLTAAEAERDAARERVTFLESESRSNKASVEELAQDLHAANASLSSLAAPDWIRDLPSCTVAMNEPEKHAVDLLLAWFRSLPKSEAVASRRAPATRMPSVAELVKIGGAAWDAALHADKTGDGMVDEVVLTAIAVAVHAAASAAQPKES